MFSRKRIRVHCTLWGSDYVCELRRVSEWFTRHAIIPRIGDSIQLPRQVSAARSKPIDDQGWSTEDVDIQLDNLVGVVTSILYEDGSNSVAVGIWPQERLKVRHAAGAIMSQIPGILDAA